MRFDIRYSCRFVYDDLVRESQNEVRACPLTDDHQHLVAYRVQTTPPSRVLSFTDWWGTRVDAFGVREPHLVLDVVAEATVETRPRPMITVDPRSDALATPDFRDAFAEYLERTPHADWGPAIDEQAARLAAAAGGGVVSQLLAIHRFVHSHLSYVPGSTYVGVPIDAVFARGEGVCQDFAHLAIAMCRSAGIPARYVSGYLFTSDDASGAAPSDDEVVEVQTHAWFEAAVPGVGWVALDPTNGRDVQLRHVAIGRGRDYDDVPPLRGVYAGTAGHELDVTVEIRRVGSAAMATAPASGAAPAGPMPPAPRTAPASARPRPEPGVLQQQPGVFDPRQQQAQQQQQQHASD
jgi:transglutaminase-like putative cysteine protease